MPELLHGRGRMSDRLELGAVTLCRHCRKAIGELKGYPSIGWLHFATHDGHRPEPVKWMREGW